MPTLPRAVRYLVRGGLLLAAAAAIHPASALTITPFFDISITGAANALQVEAAITAAIGTLDGLYSNAGTVGIVFKQGSGSFLGQSTSADYSFSYGGYVSALTAASAREPKNTVLSSAVANLSSGNMPGSGGGVLLTSANARVGLGLSGASGCFNSGGAFVNTCGQSYDGLVTLTTSFTLDYGMTPVSGQYSAIDIQRDRRGRARNQRNPGRRRSGIGAERDRGGQHGLQYLRWGAGPLPLFGAGR